jgi:hypothetical protein
LRTLSAIEIEAIGICSVDELHIIAHSADYCIPEPSKTYNFYWIIGQFEHFILLNYNFARKKHDIAA